jgi:hypothetical protein
MPTNETNNSEQQLPIAKNEDVEFSAELADEDDMEAQQRANAADHRQDE